MLVVLDFTTTTELVEVITVEEGVVAAWVEEVALLFWRFFNSWFSFSYCCST